MIQMMKKISVFSRAEFEKIYNTLSENQKSKIAFISVTDFGSDFIDNDKINFLNLKFDDAETQESWTVKLFDEQMANQILNFCDLNKDKERFIVHCTAGISRSGAIGEVLSFLFGENYLDFKKRNPQIIPNYLVKKILTKQYLKKDETETDN